MVEDLLAARLQMAFSLGFHIVFASIGMTMPFLMAFAEGAWLRTKKPVYRDLAKAWSKGVAIFFAIGAVSGTLLSFELGLLFPGFMEHAGPIIGMPFSYEGAAFFLEAIAIGFFLYGWERLSPRMHFLSGVAVGITGLASGILVVSANAWMNAPTGFEWVDGQAVNVDPMAAMLNPAWATEALHMVLAAFVSTSFAVAGVHAFRLLKAPKEETSEFHQRGMKIALGFGAICALLQPLSGDLSAKDVAVRQPAKFAAMEAHFETSAPASLLLGGIPNEETREVSYGLHIPYALSFLAHGDFEAEVTGLDQIPEEDWPPVVPTHLAFQTMVGCGMALALLGILFLVLRKWAPTRLRSKTFLRLVMLATPLGFIATEAGWTVTEVGRQPWVIYGIMRTEDAVTPMPGLWVSFVLTTAIYLFLAGFSLWLLKRQILRAERRLENAK